MMALLAFRVAEHDLALGEVDRVDRGDDSRYLDGVRLPGDQASRPRWRLALRLGADAAEERPRQLP